MFMSMNRSGKIGININSQKKVASNISLKSNQEETMGENEAVEQFEQIVTKSQEAEEMLAEVIEAEPNLVGDKRLHSIATILAQINAAYSKGSTALKKFIENYKDLMNLQEKKFLVSNFVGAAVNEELNANQLVKRA